MLALLAILLALLVVAMLIFHFVPAPGWARTAVLLTWFVVATLLIVAGRLEV